MWCNQKSPSLPVGTHSHILPLGSSLAASYEVSICLSHAAAILLTRNSESPGTHTDVYTRVHSSFAHSSSKLETIRYHLFINR